MAQDVHGQGWVDPATRMPQNPAFAPQASYGAPAAPTYGVPAYPPTGYAQNGFGAPGWQQPARGTNGFAVASFVLGIVSFSLLSIVFAAVALKQIRERGEKGRGLAIAGVVLSVLWFLAGIGVAVSGVLSEPTRDDAGTVVDAGDVQAQDLAVGDCYTDPGGFDDPAGTEVQGLGVVPCATPHFAEAYGEFEVTGTTYPGEDAVIDLASQGCYDRFAAFVGRPYEESSLDITYLYPLAENWPLDRTITCSVVDAGYGDLTGSMAGSGR